MLCKDEESRKTVVENLAGEVEKLKRQIKDLQRRKEKECAQMTLSPSPRLQYQTLGL